MRSMGRHFSSLRASELHPWNFDTKASVKVGRCIDNHRQVITQEVDLHFQDTYLADTVTNLLPVVLFRVPLFVLRQQFWVVANRQILHISLDLSFRYGLNISLHKRQTLILEIHKNTEYLTWVLAPPAHGVESLFGLDDFRNQRIDGTVVGLKIVNHGTEIRGQGIA